MSGFPGWFGSNLHCCAIAEAYWKHPTEELAQKLVREDRRQSWIFFCECLYRRVWLAGVLGLKVLGERKCIPLLRKTFSEETLPVQALRFAIQGLSILRDFSFLAAISQDSSVPVPLRLEVLRQLSTFPHPENVRLFLRLLRSPQQKCQLLAIETLGMWQVEQAVSELRVLLQGNLPQSRKKLVFLALSQISSPEAISALRDFLLDAEPLARVHMASWLLRYPQQSFLALFPLLQGATRHHPELQKRLDDIFQDLEHALHLRFRAKATHYKEIFEQALYRLQSENAFTSTSQDSTSSQTELMEAQKSGIRESSWSGPPPSHGEIEACISILFATRR
ncbi:MAG: HEAT repeat domain-containing protein [Myxococcota bacterium]